MLKIINFSIKNIAVTILLVICIIFGFGNLYLTTAQETKEDKCTKIIENFGKTVSDLEKSYVTCAGSSPLKDLCLPSQISSFGVVGLEGEWARLDSLSYTLQIDKELIAYIVIYGGKVNKYDELKERPKPLIHYLINKRGIDPKRIKVIEGGFREKFEFELWTSQSDKIFPPLTPTVEREKVIFRGRMKPLPVDF